MNNSHDEKGRFAASGQTSTGITKAARERVAMRAMADARKYLAARTSIRNINPPAMYPNKNPNARMERTDMPIPPHGRGIANATRGKSLSLGGGGGGGG
jgi:hypothetical protein